MQTSIHRRGIEQRPYAPLQFVRYQQMFKSGSAQDFARERQQSQVASALDRTRQFTLMLGTGPGLATGTDFAIIGDKAAQRFRLLIIDNGILVHAELAFTGAGKEAPRPTLRIVLGGLIGHDLTPRDKYSPLKGEFVFLVAFYLIFAGIVVTTAIQHNHFVGNDFSR